MSTKVSATAADIILREWDNVGPPVVASAGCAANITHTGRDAANVMMEGGAMHHG